MTDPATLRQGDTVLVRAIVDRAPVGSSISVHVGNGTVLAVPADIACAPRRVRFGRDAEADVLLETSTGWLVLDTAPMPTVQHRDWCEPLPAGESASV